MDFHSFSLSYEDKWVYLIPSEHLPDFKKKKFIVFPFAVKRLAQDLRQVIESVDNKYFVFTTPFFEQDLVLFKRQFKKVVAGGGIVLNEKDEMLLIFRKKKWDLPKGKINLKEPIKLGAKREVEEETSIKVDRVAEKIKTTYHFYLMNDLFYLKENHWYKMHSQSKYKLKPQLEEDITDVRWVAKSDLKEYMKLSFSSIAKLIKFFLKEEKKERKNAMRTSKNLDKIDGDL